MFCSGRTFCNAIRAPLARGIAPPSPRQTIRWNSSNLSLTTLCRNQPPFALHAPSHKVHSGLRLDNALPSGSRRAFASSSVTARLLRRLGQAGKLVLVLVVGSVSLSIVLVSARVWSILRPPYLSLWPDELRKDVQLAEIARGLDITGGSVEPLTRAWNTIQKLPLDALNPGPSIKIFTIAMWLADAFEKDNQGRKAYEVLCDVVTLYRARFEKSDQISGMSDCRTSPAGEEKRCLISILLKLASLSERCEPAAKGRWISSALREVMVLFSLCKDIPADRFVSGISALQELSEHDPSFSGLAYEQRKDIASSSENDSPDNARNPIKMEDVYGDAAGMPLPAWAMPNIGTAIAGPFEHVGLYAERLGFLELALSTYDLACDSLLSMTPTVSEEDITFPHWTILIWFLRIRNRQLNVHMRLLESDTHLVDWLLRLYEARKALSAAERALVPLHNSYMKNAKKWAIIPQFHEPLYAYIFEVSSTFRNKGIWLERAGDNKEAVNVFEQSIGLADILQDKVAAEKTRAYLEKAERRRVEGKTTLAAQLTPGLLKEWEEVQKRKRASKATEVDEVHAAEEH